MIPTRKKTPEEIAALREALGISTPPTEPAAPAALSVLAPVTPSNEVIETNDDAIPVVISEPIATNSEPVIQLDHSHISMRPEKVVIKPSHSLRKHELPLIPASAVTQKTSLPDQRHNSRDIAQLRRREALATIQLKPNADPAAYLRSQAASPFLIGPGYLFAIAAATTATLRYHFITPIALLSLATVILLFIALRKPRSRHHAALLFILVFLTLVFGALYYAPLFNHGP